ncbi:MAG: ROK family protein [Bacteroidales bacterium]|nr:ROK family protein [Bacteroidales bacterium]MBN2749197.1 ROK family protein [Bacteroidales bacterium]
MVDVVAGIDIGGTNTVIGLVNRDGDCISEVSLPTQAESSFANYLASIVSKIDGLVQVANGTVRVKGIGIGAPNGSYNLGAIVDAPNLKWKGILPICRELKLQTKLPVALTNDANAAAVGEMLFGEAKGMKDFIVITLGTGLGSGIVSNGKLVIGNDGFAGEMGHTVVKPFGRQCGCGKRGCLETYVSATGICRTVYKLLASSNQPSMLRSISFEQLTSKMITEAAQKGDPIAREAFEYTGRILGTKLSDAVAFFSPEAIFLFGGLSKAGDLILDPTKRHMEENMFPVFKNNVKIIPSGLNGKNAAVMGAAALIWQELE